MELQPYKVVQADTVQALEEECNKLLEMEEVDDDFTFYYMPLGTVQVARNWEGHCSFIQAFIVSSHPDMDEIDGEFPVYMAKH